MKRLLNITLLLIFLVSLISFTTNAALGDIFRAGLTPIEDFFTGGWQNYEKTIVFLVFFFLFFSAYLIGMKKAMGGELTRAHTVFAFTAAFLSAFIITVSMRFDWVNLKYIAWFLIAVLTLFLIYSLLLKLGLEKHKFLAFLLALILTALLLWLLWYLMHEGRPLEDLGRINAWFSDVVARAKSAQGKKPELEAGPPITPEKKPPAVVTQPPKAGQGWNWLWLLLLVPFLVGGGVWLRKRRLGPRKEEEDKEKKRREVEVPYDRLKMSIETLEKLKRRKEKILEIVDKLEGKKNELIRDFGVIKKEIGEKGMKHFVNEILPSLRYPESKDYKKLKDEENNCRKLFDINQKMQFILKSLLYIENYILTNLNVIKQIGEPRLNPNRLPQFNQLLQDLGDNSRGILNELTIYFKDILKAEQVTQNQIAILLNKKNIENRIKEEWIKTDIKKDEQLKSLFEKELNEYKKIKELLTKEKENLSGIIKILKEEVKEEEKKGKKGEEEKRKKGKPASGIKPIKVPRFVTSDSEMIRKGACEKKDREVSKEILDKTYKEVLSRFNEIHDKGLDELAKKIRITGSTRFSNKYVNVKRRENERNPYRERSIYEVVRLIGETYGWLTMNWDNNAKNTVGKRIEIIKKSGESVDPFTEKKYEGKDLLVSSGDATKLQIESKNVVKKKEELEGVIRGIEKLERAWRVWWNMFALGVWQMNRLIRTLNRVTQEQGIKQPTKKVIPVEVKRRVPRRIEEPREELPPKPPFT